MTMGEYIKQLRLEHGWSQEELGKKVGVNRAAVNKWEQGTVENIKRSTIKALSSVLGVSPCDLMKWDEPKETEKKLNIDELIEQSYGKNASDMLSLFLKLDNVDQLRIIERMETLLDQEKYSIQEGLKNA